MSDISPDTTVQEIVVKHPESRAVLERLGVEYCCGGKRKLKVAVLDSGHSVKSVMDEIQKAIEHPSPSIEKRRDWSSATATELVNHILNTHHVFIKSHLPKMQELFGKVLKAHGARHGAMIGATRKVFLALTAEIELHLHKEEEILFPYILELDAFASVGGERPTTDCGTVRNPISQMELEHENVGEALAQMRRLTSDYELPQDSCPSFAALFEGLEQLESDLHEHIHLENNILFPEAIALEDRAEEGTPTERTTIAE